MPSFTTQNPSLQATGPILELQIAVPAAVQASLVQGGQPVPQPITVSGLIDTGASACVLQQGLAAQLNLNPIGSTSINTPSSTNVQCYEYAVRYVLPNNVTVEGTMIEAPLAGQNIQCLLGRDLLAHGTLIYIGYANLFSLSF